jgi:hypothetical protein
MHALKWLDGFAAVEALRVQAQKSPVAVTGLWIGCFEAQPNGMQA